MRCQDSKSTTAVDAIFPTTPESSQQRKSNSKKAKNEGVLIACLREEAVFKEKKILGKRTTNGQKYVL